MNRIVIGTGLAAALCLAAASSAQAVEAPIPAQPPSAPSVPQPVPPPAAVAARPAPRIELPNPPPPAAQQGATQPPRPMPRRSRAHADHRNSGSHVDRAVADSFTRQLNQRELDSLEPGGGLPAADPPRPSGRGLYPPE